MFGITNLLVIFQDSISNSQYAETESNLETIRTITRACQETLKQKVQLAKEVLNGVHDRRSDEENEKLDFQPVPTIDGWVGDTACGTQLKRIEEKRANAQQSRYAKSDDQEGEHNDGEVEEDNDEGGI